MDADGGNRLLTDTGGEHKGFQRVQTSQTGAFCAHIGQQITFAADAHIPGGGVQHSLQRGLLQGLAHTLLSTAAVKGQGGRQTEEITGVHVGDVLCKVCRQLIVGTTLGHGAFFHPLPTPVIVHQTAAAGFFLPEEGLYLLQQKL